MVFLFEKRSKTYIQCVEYISVFLGFFLMFLFIVPESDVHLFALETDGSFSSVFTYSLNYGNGRLLGNILGVYFSYHFVAASLLIPLLLTLLTALLNCIIWDNNAYTVFPMAVLITLPSTGMVEECYYLFAAFCNYVVPVVLIMISLLIIKQWTCTQFTNSLRQNLRLFVLFVCGVSSCLFSENTTIVAFVISVLLVIYYYIQTKKISACLVLNVFSVLLGAVIMYLIPILTDTGIKMQGYRHIAATPVQMIKQCVVSFLRFANIFNQMYIPIFLLSLSMFFLCLKQKRRMVSLKKAQLTFFAIYPFMAVGLGALDSHSLAPYATLYDAIDALGVILFVANVLITIMLTEEKSVRLPLLLMAVVAISTVAPMMIVNQSGSRTYYTTFVCVAVMSLWLLRLHITEFSRNVTNKAVLRSCFSKGAACCFLILSLALFLQSVNNYDFYVIRSKYVADKIVSNEDYYIPYMPYESISFEDAWDNTISFAFPSASDSKQVTISIRMWEEFENYRKTILYNPIYAVSFAIENWEYKDPCLPDSLCN